MENPREVFSVQRTLPVDICPEEIWKSLAYAYEITIEETAAEEFPLRRRGRRSIKWIWKMSGSSDRFFRMTEHFDDWAEARGAIF